MENRGKGQAFVDRAKELGTYNFAISWGANFADFDNDTDLDLYVSNGDLNPNCTPMGNFYFENNEATFTDKSRVMGVNDYGVGRGSVVFDIDNDGDLDILVVNQKPVREYPVDSHTKLFRNNLSAGNWLKIALDGTSAEKNGIGSRVTVVAGKTRMIREVDGGGSSHLSQNSTIVHFGLGSAKVADSIIVTWLGGKKQILLDQNANQLLKITEIEDKIKVPWGLITLLLGGLMVLLFILKKRKKIG